MNQSPPDSRDPLFDNFSDFAPPPPTEVVANTTSSPRLVCEEIDSLDSYLQHFAGKEFIGLPQKTLPSLDRNTLGLRGLLLLAAPPNFGKTALALQIALDVIRHNPDACALIVSLEMSRFALMTRLLSHLSGLDWQTFVQGVPSVGISELTWTSEQIEKKKAARSALSSLGKRLLILDRDNMASNSDPNVSLDFSADSVLARLAQLKQSCQCTRTFVLVDYLQVWPLPSNSYHKSDIEADQWRMNQMLKLRSHIDPQAFGNGTVLVISETNKQSWQTDAEENLGAVMGSARSTYAPDCVMLLRPFSNSELCKFLNIETKDTDQLTTYRSQLAESGFSLTKLCILKGRDGFSRGSINLLFYFRQSKFSESFDIITSIKVDPFRQEISSKTEKTRQQKPYTPPY